MSDLFVARTGAEFPHGMAAISEQMVGEFAALYLAELESRVGSKALRVINTAPINSFYLGLISLLFPNARIIHCLRDPMDVCLESYFRAYVKDMHKSCDLLDHAFLYAQSERLMNHWKSVLNNPILTIRYEGLVRQPEHELRKLLAFLNLDWNEGCLDFYRPNRSSINAARVTSTPLNDAAVGRWKHYERHLDPLKRALVEYGVA